MEIIKKTSFDRIYALQLAIMVAKKGSFIATAKYMGIPASNVTKEIKKLEEYYATPIFIRTTRSLSLTDEGKMILLKGQKLLTGFFDLEEEIKGKKIEARGALRVTAPTTLGQFFLAPVFAAFQKENPYIDLDIRLTDRILDPIEQNIDLSIRTAFSLKDSSLYVKQLKPLKRVIVASEEYINKFSKPKSPTDLFKHNCLLYMRGESPFIWTFKRGKKDLDINVNGTYRTNNLISLITACESSLGLLNIPEYLVQEQINSGKLVVVMKGWKLPEHNIYLLTGNKPSESQKLKRLVDFLVSSID